MRMMKLFFVVMILCVAAGRYSVAADQAADTWASVAKYEFGASRTNLYAIEEEVRSAPAKKYGQYEEKILALLNTPGATYEAKDFACRMLRVVGSEKCVPVLAPLLTDEKMAHMARYAIQGLPFSSVDEALRSALGKAKGNQKVGVISSIAARGDKKAVALLQPLVTDSDAAVAKAAISALGNIATPDALSVLTEAKVVDCLKTVVMESRLMCADALLAKGKEGKAADIYKEMLADGNPRGIKAAAITGLARADGDNALPKVIEMLKSQDGSSQRAAGKALMEIKGKETAKAVLDVMGCLSADAQVIAMNVLVASGAKAAAHEIGKMTSSSDDAVKIAAIRALAELGDASNVELLAGLVKGGGDVGKAAVESLARLKGKGVSDAITKTLANVDAASRATLIGSLAERQSPEIIPDLMKYADDVDETVRAETMKALGALIQEKEIPVLIGMMLKAKPERVRTAAEQAVQMASAKVKGEGKRVEPLVAAMKDAKVEERAVILHCLGRLGGDKALEIVRANIKDKDENVQDAAIRAMADWTDEGALADLRELSKTAPKENLKIIAFRGLVKLIALPANVKKSPAKTAKALAEAMSLASRPDEKKLVLGSLSGIADLAALDAAQKCIQDETLKTEAELACVKIAQRFRPGKERDKAMAVVKTIAATTKAESVRKQAESALNRK
ncbi:MAG: hypothetical protein A2283_01220 [Lentisphaerae bacterium RIFOXYA12_FULL_48_11]|nr:MAG: hypothetical protein A2283_01220 [Lentisphaerae bacterium RIFOXYA12_FULL_48_11]